MNTLPTQDRALKLCNLMLGKIITKHTNEGKTYLELMLDDIYIPTCLATVTVICIVEPKGADINLPTNGKKMGQ